MLTGIGLISTLAAAVAYFVDRMNPQSFNGSGPTLPGRVAMEKILEQNERPIQHEEGHGKPATRNTPDRLPWESRRSSRD
jgi:hypothetical protein